ncbi:hypothetical protein Acr_00g0064440 [Actinidia rufa]|uniref:DUF7787 domain-containing protein n=1 Tax=Actinidia rufa TaxID=165716 RepID=A0A7J0DPI7_9ERIC|nr:hypothetical protein Acr_00g0064440 [Actinidia rufa]
MYRNPDPTEDGFCTLPIARLRNQMLESEPTSFFSMTTSLSSTAATKINLTINLLNQVITMHGFKKIRNTPKKILIDAVNSMDLMDPSRSTLNDENVSSHAFVTLEEVVKDLEYLNWKECCVTSIQTLNSVNYDLVLQNNGASPTKSKAKKSTKRRKLPPLSDVTTTADNCSQSVCSSAVGKGSRSTTLVPRRIASNVTGDGDFSATFGEVITARIV